MGLLPQLCQVFAQSVILFVVATDQPTIDVRNEEILQRFFWMYCSKLQRVGLHNFFMFCITLCLLFNFLVLLNAVVSAVSGLKIGVDAIKQGIVYAVEQVSQICLCFCF